MNNKNQNNTINNNNSNDISEESIYTTVYLSIQGMHCSSCAKTIENRLKKINGINSAYVFITEATAEINFDPSIVDITRICQIIQELGYKATSINSDIESADINKSINEKSIIFNTILALPVIIISMFLPDTFNFRLAQFLFSTLIIIFPARIFFINSLYALKNKSLNMDVLITIAIITAWLVSTIATFFPKYLSSLHMVYFESAALLSLFILFGKWIENIIKNKALNELKTLSSIERSKIIKVSQDNIETLVPINSIQTNDIIKILPSQMVPVDGIIVKGETSLDEKLITGESIPIPKAENDKVISGSINLSSVIYVRVTNCGAASTINTIIRAMRRAQIEKPKIQRIADTIASNFFIPTVFFLSFATFIFWFIFQNSFEKALVHSITVLVIACPCALGLATPMAVVIACLVSYKNGILIKKPSILENLKDIDYILFDKTNTITSGKPKVRDFYLCLESSNSYTQDYNIILSKSNLFHLKNFLELCNSSTHPLSQAIKNWILEKISSKETINQKELKPDFEHIEEIKGFGIIGTARDQSKYIIGSKTFINKTGIDASQSFEQIISPEATIVYLAINNKLFAVTGLVDEITNEALDVIKEIQNMGIKTVVVSGDREETVRYICQKAGINEYYYNQSPQDKLKIVNEYKSKGKICFIGDGFNDAPALAAADISISFSHGADLAKASTDIILVKSNLSLVLYLMMLSKFTIKIIKQNLFLASVYNFLALPIASGVTELWLKTIHISITPEIGALLMGLSSISVVLNSLKLYHNNTPHYKPAK